MKIQASIGVLLITAGLGAGSTAQAREVYWSVGLSSPGVQVGVSNAPVIHTRPLVVLQPPVYYSQPPVLYGVPQMVYTQPAVVYQSQTYYPRPYSVRSGWAPPVYQPGWGPRHHWNRGNRDRGEGRRGFDADRHGGGRR